MPGGGDAMHQPWKVLAAAAAVAALTACPCAKPRDTTTIQVAQVPTATLLAFYEPVEQDRTFSAQVQVDDGAPCDALAPSATGDVSGVAMRSEQDGGAACFCDGSMFNVMG